VRPTGTRERILAAARDLFIERGVQQTSLRDIAEHLGLTKPALYYHFDSREALLASLVQPLIDDCEAFVAERKAPVEVPSFLSEYFDLLYRHRELLTLLVRDLATLGALDLGSRLLQWRQRITVLLVGSRASLAERVRATVAIGGLSDCIVELPDEPVEKVKAYAVEAASVVLQIRVATPRGTVRAPLRR
ncbi:MAG TPA: helix-turn-helix domain-containing protein, partial [Polyangiaceae bacterium]|nr:helix-turn-helix domain-containing protein [Polyangiaceae bacterium]